MTMLLLLMMMMMVIMMITLILKNKQTNKQIKNKVVRKRNKENKST